MTPERAIHSNSDLIGNLGCPPEPPKNTRPWSPEMAKSMAAMIAHIDAQRLEKEAEMNTPQGRKKAAQAAEAELARKRHAWASRAWALPIDGFKGIPDSAEDRELEIYTRTYDHQHKYWGVKPVGMAIWDFWNIRDPEVTRYHDANQETPATPEPSTTASPPPDSPQKPRPTAKSKRRQKPPVINPTNRIRKSNTLPKVNDKTRKSLAHKIDAGKSGLEDQVRVVKGAIRAGGRPNRNKAAVTVPEAEQKTARAKSSVHDGIPSQPKRPRGRPPAKGKSTERGPNQKKASGIQGNARVTKSSRKELQPSAPSTHKMRTRRAGPAELLQLP